MKHLFLFTLVCGVTNLFGQHIASSSLSVMRNARAFSTLSSVRSANPFDSQQYQKERICKPFNNDIATEKCTNLPSHFSPALTALVPAIGSTIPIIYFGIIFRLDPNLLYQGPSVVWALSTLCIYKYKIKADKEYRAALKAHNDLAHQGSQVLQESFKHPFIKEVLPFRGCPDLKQAFGQHVERRNISSEDAYKELEVIRRQLTKVITDNRYIAGEDSQRDVFDKAKAMTDDLTFVLATIAPENALHNERKMKYAYMNTSERIKNRVQSSDE